MNYFYDFNSFQYVVSCNVILFSDSVHYLLQWRTAVKLLQDGNEEVREIMGQLPSMLASCLPKEYHGKFIEW